MIMRLRNSEIVTNSNSQTQVKFKYLADEKLTIIILIVIIKTVWQ